MDHESRLADPATGAEALLSLEDLMARYRVGKTKANDITRESWFPAPVISSPRRRWSLPAIVNAELARSRRTDRTRGRPRL